MKSKCVSINLRTTQAIYDQVAASAAQNRRSMAQELEYRYLQAIEQEASLRATIRAEIAAEREERVAEVRLPNMRAEDLDEWLRH